MKLTFKKFLAGGGIVLGVLGAGEIPITVETIPAREITISGTGCFEQTENGVLDISQEEYNSLALKGARPVTKAWCGTKFETAERQPKKGDYWTDGSEFVFLDKSYPLSKLENVSLDKVKGEIKITNKLGVIIGVSADIAAVDSSSQSGSGVTSLTYAHVVSGANTFISVMSLTFDNEGTSDGQVSTVTYNGDTVYQGVEQAGLAATNNHAESWYLTNPDAGTNNVVVTFVGNTSNATSAAFTVSGAKQSAQPDAVGGGTSSGATATATLTSVADNSWAVSNATVETTAYSSKGASQTTIALINGDYDYYSYSTSKTPPGAVSHTYTNSNGSDKHVWTILSIAPVLAETPVKVRVQNGQVKVQASNPIFQVTSASSAFAATVSTVTESVTTPTCANRVMVASITAEDATAGDLPISNFTFNGIAGVEVTEVNVNNQNTIALWYLINPPGGITANAVGTFAGTVDSGAIVVSTICGVAQKAPEASNSASANPGTSVSANITTVTPDSIVVEGSFHSTAASSNTIGAGQTLLINVAASGHRIMASFENGPTTPGVTTMSWTSGTSSRMGLIGASFERIKGGQVKIQ